MRRMLDKSELVSQEQYEELVKVVPTDVNIVEDEGAWQIQLEHDSEVLSITDLTPFVESIAQQKPSWHTIGTTTPDGTLSFQLPTGAHLYTIRVVFSTGPASYNINLPIGANGGPTLVPYFTTTSAGTTITGNNFVVAVSPTYSNNFQAKLRSAINGIDMITTFEK